MTHIDNTSLTGFMFKYLQQLLELAGVYKPRYLTGIKIGTKIPISVTKSKDQLTNSTVS